MSYLNKEVFVDKKHKKWLVVGLVVLVAGIIIGVVTPNLDRIMNAVWEFRDGYMGLPRRKY